jgi:uncharacterized protein (TIGR03382 family)
LRSPGLALLALTSALALLNLGATYVRSTIPAAFAGRIESVRVLPEKHPGRDDVWIATIGGDAHTMDAAVGRRLLGRARAAKEAWSAEMTVDGESVPLVPSADTKGMAIAMPAVLLITLALLRPRRRAATAAGRADY